MVWMLIAVFSSATLIAAAAGQGQAAAPVQPAAQSGMADMMKMHQNMMAEMKAAEARLDTLVKTMNAASGDAKTNAIAAVVNELVAQRRQMHAHMSEMHAHMSEMHMHMMGGRGMMMKH
jgi:hypothetical protein